MTNPDVMTHQVLARKWRPHKLTDMVGQEHILRMLTNALTQLRLHHAYLFTGTRGVGKTTLARIIAKCLNCNTGVTPTPCEQCSACQAIDAGNFLDLFEIDAASRTKVEDTREILDNVPYPPTQGRYKIYLIDEVHMLSNHSFNALLKTLEEPPAHVIFILATTDPKRLPITILSRCLQFHLKRIPVELIAKRLQFICEQESVTHELPALQQLAHAADGSLRDALSLLDQAIAFGLGKVTTADVYAMLGSLAQDDLLPLLTAVIKEDKHTVYQLMNALAERAPDFQQVLEEMISLLHRLALLQILPESVPSEMDTRISELAKATQPQQLQLFYQIALLGRRDLAISPAPRLGFEMTLLRMLAFTPNAPLQIPQNAAATKSAVTQPESVNASSEATQQAPAMARSEATKQSPPLTTDWATLLTQLKLTGMAQALAQNCTLVALHDNKIELALSAKHMPMVNAKLKERLTESVSTYFNRDMQLVITPTDADIATPAKQMQSEYDAKLSAAKQTIASDPLVQQLVAMYDATVDVNLTNH